MGKYFGTDGFRGEANVGLTFDHAVKIGRFLGWYFGERIGKKDQKISRTGNKAPGAAAVTLSSIHAESR